MAPRQIWEQVMVNHHAEEPKMTTPPLKAAGRRVHSYWKEPTACANQDEEKGECRNVAF